MPPRIRVKIKKEPEDEEKHLNEMNTKVDAETQTDPEITGVDSEDFETDYEDDDEDGVETESSEDEQYGQEEESVTVEERAALTNKGTSSKPIPRKKIELKYYFGDDMPDAELKKLAEAEVIVPPGLEIKSSNIPQADLGVFAKCVIPKHEFFGPYIGQIVSAEDAQEYRDSPHIWEVRDDFGKLLHLIDGRNAFQSNWLRYVNCAQSLAEQNIKAVQYDNSIYYMASKDINIGDELLIWYGETSARKMKLKGAKKSKSVTHEEEESFTCKNCKKMYTNPASLIGHLKFKCNTGQQRSIFMPQPSIARKNVPKKIEVTEEYAREQNEKLKKFKCDVCGKGFIRNYTLQCHMLIHKGVKEHKCDYEGCGKEFTLLKHLQRHKLVHTGEKPYKCHLCGRAFSQQGSLQAHSRTHTGIKPYKCKVCGRAFALQSPLLSHMKTHSSVKSYKCVTCGKSFTHRNTLARHELIHTGLRPYKCGQCGKTFTQTNDLKRHSRIHTGIRPYKCHICGKAFTVEFTLVCHIRTHTGIRPYKCEYCDKSFTQPGARLKHVRKVHPDLPVPVKRQEEDQEAAAADAKAMKAMNAVIGKESNTVVPNIDGINGGFDRDSDEAMETQEPSVAMDTAAVE